MGAVGCENREFWWMRACALVRRPRNKEAEMCSRQRYSQNTVRSSKLPVHPNHTVYRKESTRSTDTTIKGGFYGIHLSEYYELLNQTRL